MRGTATRCHKQAAYRIIVRTLSASIAGLVVCLLLALPARAEERMIVFAAASLRDALEAVADRYAVTGEARPLVSYAGSGTLARQIEHGAPAAIFISADVDWMDYLQSRNLIVPDSRSRLLSNSLVIATPASTDRALTIGPELLAYIGNDRLAIGDPASVPAGRYGEAALRHHGLWDRLEARLVRAENVRSALAFVERGEVAAAIVYATDARASARVRVAAVFPPESHPSISYPLAIVNGHDGPAARRLHAFLQSSAAHEVFEAFGFGVVPDAN